MAGTERDVERHYAVHELEGAILSGLETAGVDTESLDPRHLAPVDQLHARGLEATLELLRLAEIPRGCRVLDVGCGIGGAARLLAAERGCRVTGIDLSEEFIALARRLTELTQLDELVELRRASALELPFDEGTFDAVWTQHAVMNIAGKKTLYAEIRRVLRPGGRLALHDILAGNETPPLHFPVPWAGDASISFLVPAGEVRATLESLGFRTLAWCDVTPAARDWAREKTAALSGDASLPPLGPHLTLGPDWRAKLANLSRNLEEGRVSVVMGVLEKMPSEKMPSEKMPSEKMPSEKMPSEKMP